MLTRRSTQVALEVALWLALEPAGEWRRIREIAAGLSLPAPYLSKIVQNLTRTGLLRAMRGPLGGVQLSPAARKMRLWDILSAIEPAGELERCLLSMEACSDINPCPLHEGWVPIRNQIMALLQSETLREFADEARRRGMLGWARATGEADSVRPPVAEVTVGGAGRHGGSGAK